jgi:hypothetical protein
MIIKSQFKDYYDYIGLNYQEDYKDKYYIRTTEQILIDGNDFFISDIDNSVYRSYSYLKASLELYSVGVLVIGRKMFPVIFLKKEPKTYFFDFALMDLDLKPNNFLGVPLESNADTLKRLETLKEKMSHFDATKLCLKYKAPILFTMFENAKEKDLPKDLRAKTMKYAYTNVLLKDFNLVKVLPALQAYQEIDYIISNILVSDIMPLAKMSDLAKIESHGFDNKYSFRKEKK